MRVGAAQVEITPGVGVELCGYAARVQPSAGVMDPLHCRALYLQDKLLWLALDLIAIPAGVVGDFRSWAGRELGLRAEQVMVSATHTHSGPATIRLNAAGRMDEDFMRGLPELMQDAARQAVGRPEDCEIVSAQTLHPATQDRRKKRTSHVDHRLLALGFRRANSTFVATVLNYPMHPVALGHVNRMISGDWCGYAAEEMATLPGKPISLVTNGACGNLNPPGEGWPREEVRELGRGVALAVKEKLVAARAGSQEVRAAIERVRVELEVLSGEEMDRVVAAEVAKVGEGHPWYGPIRAAVGAWRAAEKPGHVEIELHGVRLGEVRLVGVNCEMFSRFTAGLRERVGEGVYTVGYTNGAFGYVAHAAAYEEGGYEVESAHLFYNSFRPRRGALEMLGGRAGEVLRGI